jgi:hypothetical protein
MRFVRCKTTSRYEAMILTPEQAYAIVLRAAGQLARSELQLAASVSVPIASPSQAGTSNGA